MFGIWHVITMLVLKDKGMLVCSKWLIVLLVILLELLAQVSGCCVAESDDHVVCATMSP